MARYGNDNSDGKTKRRKRLKDIHSFEVAGVRFGANAARFVIIKEDGSMKLDISKLTELHSKIGKVVTVTKAGKLSEEAIEAVGKDLVAVSAALAEMVGSDQSNPMDAAKKATAKLGEIKTLTDTLAENTHDLNVQDQLDSLLEKVKDLAKELEGISMQEVETASEDSDEGQEQSTQSQEEDSTSQDSAAQTADSTTVEASEEGSSDAAADGASADESSEEDSQADAQAKDADDASTAADASDASEDAAAEGSADASADGAADAGADAAQDGAAADEGASQSEADAAPKLDVVTKSDLESFAKSLSETLTASFTDTLGKLETKLKSDLTQKEGRPSLMIPAAASQEGLGSDMNDKDGEKAAEDKYDSNYDLNAVEL